jgi:hypothetical protein
VTTAANDYPNLTDAELYFQEDWSVDALDAAWDDPHERIWVHQHRLGVAQGLCCSAKAVFEPRRRICKI